MRQRRLKYTEEHNAWANGLSRRHKTCGRPMEPSREYRTNRPIWLCRGDRPGGCGDHEYATVLEVVV